eukprot:4216741-Prymnesium_polylepis.1
MRVASCQAVSSRVARGGLKCDWGPKRAARTCVGRMMPGVSKRAYCPAITDTRTMPSVVPGRWDVVSALSLPGVAFRQ